MIVRYGTRRHTYDVPAHTRLSARQIYRHRRALDKRYPGYALGGDFARRRDARDEVAHFLLVSIVHIHPAAVSVGEGQ